MTQARHVLDKIINTLKAGKALTITEQNAQVIEVASIPTKNYKEVIEIRVPVRFYWSKEGDFDGVEFGEFKANLLPWQEDMVQRCLDAIGGALND